MLSLFSLKSGGGEGKRALTSIWMSNNLSWIQELNIKEEMYKSLKLESAVIVYCHHRENEKVFHQSKSTGVTLIHVNNLLPTQKKKSPMKLDLKTTQLGKQVGISCSQFFGQNGGTQTNNKKSSIKRGKLSKEFELI